VQADPDTSERVDSLAAWVGEIDSRLRVAEVATCDEKAAKELRKAVEAAAKHDPKLEDRLENRIDVLADRLATLATTVSTTAAALAKKDGEVAALKRELEDARSKLGGALAQPRSSTSSAEVEQLRKQISSLSEQKLPRKVDDRLDDLKASVGKLAERLETLSTTVSTTASGLAGREGELAALRRRLDEDDAGVRSALDEFRLAVDRGPIAELKQAVESLESESAAQKRDDERRLAATKAGFDELAGRVDALVGAVAESTRKLDAGAGELAALETEHAEEAARVDSLLLNLQQATGELSARVGELGGVATSETVDELGRQVAGLAARTEALGATVAETAAGYGDKEYEIAALGRRYEELNAEVSAGVSDLRAALEHLAERAVDPELGGRVEGIAGELAALAARVDDTGAATEGTGAVATAVADLERRLEDLEHRLEDGPDPAIEGRVDKVELALGGLATELAKLDASATARTSKASDLLAALERRLNEVVARVPSPERDAELRALGDRFQAASERVEALVGELGTALQTMPASVSTDAVEERLSALSTRVEDVEQSGSTAALEIARAAAGWASDRDALRDELAAVADAARALGEERATVRERLETLSGAVAEVGSRTQVDPVSDDRVRELAAELERSDREREALANEIAGATAFWSSGLGALEARIDSLAAGRERTPRKVDDEVVRALFDLARRLDAVERGHAEDEAEIVRTGETWAAERESFTAGLDDLTRRLDALDAADDGAAGGSAAATRGESNDGRFRLELHALELRMEHTEAAARENREAVLVQLERLASRIEWRLQRIEAGGSGEPAGEAETSPLAEVVSIHGGDA
jgi:chromosome segregation ATPase